jgi:hypothetical protein
MTTVTVIIVVLVVAALAAGAYVLLKNRRRAELQERFGPEYDRAVEGASTRREAEQHLAGVAHRRDELNVRDLDDAERAKYDADWVVVQTRFVDAPGEAVDSAETLIAVVMRERGYPVDDFDERADLIAADHPDVVQHYREAHAAHERHRSAGGIDTEDLRQSFVHYRALFAVLVQDADAPATEAVAVETPATEVPAAEVPAAEVPATETPATEAPAAEAPVAEAEVAEVPATDVPAAETPAAEAPAAEDVAATESVDSADSDADQNGNQPSHPQETR